jgi:hypothetical protein
MICETQRRVGSLSRRSLGRFGWRVEMLGVDGTVWTGRRDLWSTRYVSASFPFSILRIESRRGGWTSWKDSI